jgi:hypothetical protein
MPVFKVTSEAEAHMAYLLSQLDYQTIGIQFPAGVPDFTFFQSDQTGSEPNPASYQMVTNCSFTGGKEVWL